MLGEVNLVPVWASHVSCLSAISDTYTFTQNFTQNRLSSKDQGGMKMASINPKEFPNPINVRLSEELVADNPSTSPDKRKNT